MDEGGVRGGVCPKQWATLCAEAEAMADAIEAQCHETSREKLAERGIAESDPSYEIAFDEHHCAAIDAAYERLGFKDRANFVERTASEAATRLPGPAAGGNLEPRASAAT